MARFPIAANSDGIANESGVAGDSVSDALDTLSASGGGNLQDAYDDTPGVPQLIISTGNPLVVSNATGDPSGNIFGVSDNAGTAQFLSVDKTGTIRDAAYTAEGDLRVGAASAGQIATVVISGSSVGDVLTRIAGSNKMEWQTPAGGGSGAVDGLTASGFGALSPRPALGTKMEETGAMVSTTFTDSSSSFQIPFGASSTPSDASTFTQSTSSSANNVARWQTGNLGYSLFVRRRYEATVGIDTLTNIHLAAGVFFSATAWLQSSGVPDAFSEGAAIEFRAGLSANFLMSSNTASDGLERHDTGIAAVALVAYRFVVIAEPTRYRFELYSADGTLLATHERSGLTMGTFQQQAAFAGVQTLTASSQDLYNLGASTYTILGVTS